jgi:hypothetical protein
LQERPGRCIKSAEGLLLDVPGDHSRHEVLGERRRREPQHRPPQRAKPVEAERPYAVDLGLERFEVDWPVSHARHAALRPGLPLLFVAAFLAMMR